MNILSVSKKNAVIILAKSGHSFRDIERRINVDRRTAKKYSQQAKDSNDDQFKMHQGDRKWPPDGSAAKLVIPSHARSACLPYGEWIEEQVRLGRNAVSIYQDLVDKEGFTARYNSVKRFVRKLKVQDPEQFDRLEFSPGEEAQVDLGMGTTCKKTDSERYSRPYLFVMTLKYSRKSFRKVVWKVNQETWCKLHEEAFRYFGGAVQYVVLDNLKQGVIKPDIYDPEVNPLYSKVLAHYGAVADPARVRDPNRKGTVENAIQHTQNTCLKGKRFDSIEAQNTHLLEWEERWASPRVHGRTKRQVSAMFEEEKPHLKVLPAIGFRYFREEHRTVADDGLIQVGQSFYAARPELPHSRVMVRIYESELEIYSLKTMELLRRHALFLSAGKVAMCPEDYIYNPSRETAALLNTAKGIGPHTYELCESWFKKEGRCGQRKIQGVVALTRKYQQEIIERAAQIAQDQGIRSCKAIKNMAKALSEEMPTPEHTQAHELIRELTEYKLFFDEYATWEKEFPIQ